MERRATARRASNGKERLGGTVSEFNQLNKKTKN